MMKYCIRGVWGAVLAFLLLTPVWAGSTRGVPDSTSIRAITESCRPGSARIARNVLGISDPHAADPDVIDLIAQTGVKWVRAEFHWSQIEPVRGGPFRWGKYDRMVAAYGARGIKVQAILTYIPEDYGTDWGAIDQGFQRFAKAVVSRYAKRGVHYWEVFNEPNLPGYGWLNKRADAQQNLAGYAMLLARANAAVRAHDPRGVVILGGVASDQHRGLPLEKTMAILYDLGAGKCFDVMAFHPYGYQNQFPKARARVDRVMARYGDGNKPVWFNEYGWTEQKAMDLARNGNRTNNPMLAALGQRGSADALFWFAAKDYSARRGTPSFGLATFDLEKRPSFETFTGFVRGNQ